MRSLIIIEVEHGEDIDGIEMFTAHLANQTEDAGIDVINWTVKVDLPDCFVLDSDKAETFDYRPTHVSALDGSPAMMLEYDADDNMLMLVNEDGYRWYAPVEQWRSI